MLSTTIAAIYQELSGRVSWGKVILGLKPPVTEGFAGVCIYPRASNTQMTYDLRRAEHEVAIEVHSPLSESVVDFVARVEEVMEGLAGIPEVTRIRVDYNPGNWCEITVTVPEMENIGR
ncbi:MAG: hypothetical protein QMD66_06665 [Actinomycetota bacterium]|jgi:hypothetical protein|nr:hypothetical protein [Actinomycetota bacterium]NPV54557.1 hypothetical protein [Bacillota bacterium]